MKKYTYPLLAGAAFVLSANAVTILDEGFESPGGALGPSYAQFVEGSVIPGWTVQNNSFGEKSYLIDEARFAGKTPTLEFRDSQALILNEGTSISTTVALKAGNKYSFTIWGYQGSGSFDKDLEIEIGSTVNTLAFDFWKDAGGVQTRSFTFVAQNGDSTLRITNPETLTDYRQRVIDHLTVTQVPDGGASAALLGIGVLGLAIFRRSNS